MRSTLSYIVAVIACSVAAFSQTPETDFQVWNETIFVLPVAKAKDDKGKSFDRVSLQLITSLRLGQNRLTFVDERIGGGIDIALNKFFNVTPSYLYVAAQPGRNRREFEHRVRFDFQYNQRFRRFLIRDRNRFEYRIRNSRIDTTRYRNRFTFGVPVFRNDKEVFIPFVSDEVYYDFTVKQWSRNDLAFGVQRKLNDKVTADFFYNWRHNRAGLPGDVHAVGVNFKIKVK